MRTRALLLALVLAAGAAAVALLARSPRHGAGEEAPPASELLLLGDSLNVGVEPYLHEALPGWAIHADDEVGRPTATGLDRLRSDAGAGLPPYLVISLGTNDPSVATSAFRAAVRRVARSPARAAASSGRRSTATGTRTPASTPSCATRRAALPASVSSTGRR